MNGVGPALALPSTTGVLALTLAAMATGTALVADDGVAAGQRRWPRASSACLAGLHVVGSVCRRLRMGNWPAVQEASPWTHAEKPLDGETGATPVAYPRAAAVLGGDIVAAFWFVALSMFGSGALLWWFGEETHPGLHPAGAACEG